METKADMEWMIMVRDRCKFKNGLIVLSEGKSGGLTLFWKEDVKLDVQTYSQSHIDVCRDGPRILSWGEPEISEKKNSNTHPYSINKLSTKTNTQKIIVS